MFDTSVPLLSCDYARVFPKDVAGEHGLVVIGVGKGGERGFHMLYRFNDICERLETLGVNVVFVYPKESARHVMDPISVASAQFRQRRCLLLDDEGHFFWRHHPAWSLAVAHLDREMNQLDADRIGLQDDTWDSGLRVFFARVQAGFMY